MISRSGVGDTSLPDAVSGDNPARLLSDNGSIGSGVFGQAMASLIMLLGTDPDRSGRPAATGADLQ